MKKEVNESNEARKILAEVPQERVFRCCDGKVLRNVNDLCYAFSVMKDDTYDYHWANEKKDFSNWVRYTIGDEKLARDLERATSRSLAGWLVATRILHLVRQLNDVNGISSSASEQRL